MLPSEATAFTLDIHTDTSNAAAMSSHMSGVQLRLHASYILLLLRHLELQPLILPPTRQGQISFTSRESYHDKS